MEDEAAKKAVKRHESRMGRRGLWDQHWDDVARVFNPRRQGFVTETVEGDRRTEDIYDSTPMQAARSLANQTGYFLRPEGQTYFSIVADSEVLNDDEEAKLWLSAAEDELNDALENPRARFRQATGEADLDLVTLGTGVLFVGEGARNNSLLFQSVHLKDGVVSWDDEGNPNGFSRIKRMTIGNAVQRFGIDAFSDEVKEKHRRGNIDDKIRILHAVERREDGRENAVFAKNLPWSDVWIEYDARRTLQEGGYHEFPFVIPRWDTSSGEEYGRSPAMIALPDGNTLQAMGETMLVAGQRVADPPLFVPNDGSFTEAFTFPGGITSYDVETAVQVRGNPYFALDTGANLPITREMQMDVRDLVWQAFFRNVLNLPVDGPEMTATEIRQRREEFIRQVGPVFGRLESDYTAPIIERSFNIMLRANALPPIPEALQGQNVRFVYESPVKWIRQQIEAAAAQLWVREQIEIAGATGKPEILDIVNFDGYARTTAEIAGIPTEMVNPTDVVQAAREARAQQQAAQAQALQAQQVAEIAKTGADALKSAGVTEAA